MDRLSDYSTSSMVNPEASFGGIRSAGLDRINRTYDAVPQNITSALSARGYGSSGNMGNSLWRAALSRAGDISGFEGGLANAAIQRQDTGASLAQRILELNRGTTSTGTTPDTSASNAFLTGGGALNNIATVMMLNKYMQPGGAPTPTDYGDYGTYDQNTGGFNYNPYNPGGPRV